LTEVRELGTPDFIVAPATSVRRQRIAAVKDLWDIATLAPAIMATRPQTCMLESLTPTRRGRREITRMVNEKPLATAQSVLGAQRVFLQHSLDLWMETARLNGLFWFNLNAEIPSAALAPIRRGVRRNSRV
jgi:hypothetical protein